MKTFPCSLCLVLMGLLCAGHLRAEDDDQIHTPGVGTEERTAILDVLHHEYQTGSGSRVKFKVNYLKVHNGWAWIKVVPLDPNGKAEGDEWPSLLQYQDDQWNLIDFGTIGQDLDESEGPQSPSKRFLQALKRKYPSLPSDIVPVGR